MTRLTLARRTRSRRLADALQNIVYHSTHAVLPLDEDQMGLAAAQALPLGSSPVEAIDGIAAALRGLPGVRMRTSSATNERLLSDKLEMTSHCGSLGVPVPATFAAESDHDLALPFLTKPRLGCGGCGITRVATQAEAARMRDLARASPGTLLAQEELQGELLHVGGVAKNGKLLQTAVYGEPHHEQSNFGPVTSIVILDAPEIIDRAAKVIDSLGLNGAFCFDYIRVADGRPMLLDVNARVFGSWLPLQQAGLDLVGSYMFAWGLSDVEPNGRIAPGIVHNVRNRGGGAAAHHFRDRLLAWRSIARNRQR